MIELIMAAAAVAAPSCPKAKGVASITIARVKDGDTFVGTCTDRFGFPEIYRLLDLDTPEKAPRAKCELEAAHAKAASAFALRLATRAGMVAKVRVPDKEKYGRYLASVTFTIDGKPVQWRDALIEAGYAVAYDGGEKVDWCSRLSPQLFPLKKGE